MTRVVRSRKSRSRSADSHRVPCTRPRKAKVRDQAERLGKPLVLLLTGGERHAQPVLPTLIERGAVKPRGAGRPRVLPERVAGYKGCGSGTMRRSLKELWIGAVIPT